MNISKLLLNGFVVSALMSVPVPAVRADDDWEDRWEDYQEELEERREEQRERWEEWREDREEALEEWREDRRRGRVRHPAWRPRVVHRGYWEEELPPPRRPGYGYYEERRPYRSEYYWDDYDTYRYDAPTVYDYGWPYDYYDYEVRRPEYRYYGTPGVGYSEYGRERSVRVGPFQVYWTR